MFLFLFESCSSNKPAPQNGVQVAPTKNSQPFPKLGPEDEILFSEVVEFLNLGNESVKDSLWFQAGTQFDSALARLSGLEATDSLSQNVTSMIQIYRDSVEKLLINTVAKTSQLRQPAPLTEQFDQQMEEVTDSSVKMVDSIVHHIDAKNYDIPLTQPLDARVLQAISVFMGSGRGYFTKWLNRKSRYEDIIKKKLDEKELPHDLMYLAMVESGFNPKAWSKASASGMWQFISGTGRRYGLMDDWWYDPRRDPLLATDAALDYLSDLYDEFGDWHQAMAAYNCGEGRIRRYREKDSTMSYWNMPLPQETRFYVPKILAAMIIGHNPERYGFKVDSPESALQFDTVTIQHCLSITTIAKASGTIEDSIISLNPALRRWCTPPNKTEYLVHIPLGSRDLFLKNYAELDKSQLVVWHHHVVSKGETIGSIASKYHVSIAAIKGTNKIKGNQLHRGQSLLIPLAPLDGQKYSEADVPEPTKRTKYHKGVYKVRRGDNLFDIARRFNLTVTQLLAANHLHAGTAIRVGQRLKLGSKASASYDDDPEVHREPAVVEDREVVVSEKKGTKTAKVLPINATATATSAKASTTPTGKQPEAPTSIYTVASQENLFSISRKLGVDEDDLREWNNIQGNRILAGQKLKYVSTKKNGDSADSKPNMIKSETPVKLAGVKAPVPDGGIKKTADEKEFYLVKTGDTWWDISVRYQSSVPKLKSLNSQLSPILKAGTRIRVR